MPLYNTSAYFGSGYLISELCPACLTGISGCFFSLVFLFACFSFFCSLWLAFQVLPGPCNLHRPGGIPRIALGKGGKSVGNLRHKPEALFALFRQFLRRISLPRLIHFLDLVLPQLMPVQAAWAGEEKTLWSCHHIRHLCTQQYANKTPSVQISYFFTSHDHVHHVRIQWNGHLLLLFSDPQMVEALHVDHFRKQASHVTHQQHLQMGLRKGMAILLYYVVGNTHYQAVLIAEDSVVNRGGKGENRLWKRVTPTVTEFAWLPPNIAESFCRNAL